MSELLIVTCTKAKTDQEFSQRPLYSSLVALSKLNSNIKYHIFKNNNRGLSVRYNEILKDPQNSHKFILFVHDDVVIEDLFIYEKLTTSPYAITGLAGAKSFNQNAQHLAWHLAANNDFVGEVAHSKDTNTWTTVFGPTKSRALVIDGLFICCNMNLLTNKNLYFDEDFSFHFYDISFCLRANQHKATCGVLPIKVTHFGMGDSMLTNDWKAANEAFKKKYCK